MQLPPKWVEYLVGQPESGMSYQNVVATTSLGEFHGIVLNCEILKMENLINANDIIDIRVE